MPLKIELNGFAADSSGTAATVRATILKALEAKDDYKGLSPGVDWLV